MTEIQALNDRMRVPGVAEVVADRGGMPAVWIEGQKADASGTVYLHGAHVAAWRPRGFDEVIFVSKDSSWQADKPIRGGVPVIFPWFGERPNPPANVPSPMHGFARLRSWDLESIEKKPAGVVVTLSLKNDAATMATWPHEFLLRHRITFGEQLIMALEITNTGKQPFTADEAQHTYFSVGDVRQVQVHGLDGITYIDKVDGFKEKKQAGDIKVTGETDRIYLDITGPVTIDDQSRNRRITVQKENSRVTVVWNPWIDRAKAIADLGDNEWPEMICAETCNASKFPITVAPGQTHRMTTTISVKGM
jgi:glucose-6-phosphate 1-epimerase